MSNYQKWWTLFSLWLPDLVRRFLRGRIPVSAFHPPPVKDSSSALSWFPNAHLVSRRLFSKKAVFKTQKWLIQTDSVPKPRYFGREGVYGEWERIVSTDETGGAQAVAARILTPPPQCWHGAREMGKWTGAHATRDLTAPPAYPHHGSSVQLAVLCCLLLDQNCTGRAIITNHYNIVITESITHIKQ